MNFVARRIEFPRPWFATTTAVVTHAHHHGLPRRRAMLITPTAMVLPTNFLPSISRLFVGIKRKAELNMRLFNSAFCDALFNLSLWSWRDSNSRPNEELICFLHVYLRFNCREQARPKPPTWTLSFKISPAAQGVRQTISDIAAPPYRNASEQQHPGDVTSPQLLQGLSFNLLFFD